MNHNNKLINNKILIPRRSSRLSSNSCQNFFMTQRIHPFAFSTYYLKDSHFFSICFSDFLIVTKLCATSWLSLCVLLIFGQSKMYQEGKFNYWLVIQRFYRILVGLRYWSRVKDDGKEVWYFESMGNYSKYFERFLNQLLIVL